MLESSSAPAAVAATTANVCNRWPFSVAEHISSAQSALTEKSFLSMLY